MMRDPKIFEPGYYVRMRELEGASWWNAAMRDAAGGLLRQVELPRSGILLDAGCGSGQTMTWFQEGWPGWQVVGVDVAFEGLRAARDGGVTQVVGGSVLALPLSGRSVDAVISLDVLQHLPLEGGVRAALQEFRRVLRPGGWLLARTNAQAWPRIPDDRRFNFHKFTAGELRQHLLEAGFMIHRLGRLNAVLGLAEIRREWRAQRHGGPGYSGLLAEVPRRGWSWQVKRAWLRTESLLVQHGLSLPMGRTLLALARSPEGTP